MVVNISFRHQDPEIAALAVKTAIDVFKAKRLEVFSDPKSQFLEAQLEYYTKRLHDAADRYETFRQQNGVYDIEQQKTLLLTQRGALDTEFNTTENQIAEETRRLASLTEQQKGVKQDRKSKRLNSSHECASRITSSA